MDREGHALAVAIVQQILAVASADPGAVAPVVDDGGARSVARGEDRQHGGSAGPGPRRTHDGRERGVTSTWHRQAAGLRPDLDVLVARGQQRAADGPAVWPAQVGPQVTWMSSAK